MRAAELTVAQRRVLDHLRQNGLVGGAGNDHGLSASDTVTPGTFLRPGETFHPQVTLASEAERAPPESELPVIDVAGLGKDVAPAGERAELAVEGVLGEGGMGRVYSVRQRSLGRTVAVKTLLQPDAASRTSLLAEGRLTGALEHPGIVPVHALGRTATGDPLLVMKRVEGRTLREVLEESHREGSTERRRIEHLEILMAVCNAAHFAHTHGVIHRDIKPSNVMLGRFGEVYLVDWGIAARLGPVPGTDRPSVTTTRMLGTPSYMAPEMAGAGVLDARTDVYLLGATLHTLLTGTPRHRGDSWLDVVYAAVESEPPSYDRSIPAELAAIARRATEKEPAERYQTALALREDLARYVRLHTVLELVHTAEERLERSVELAGDRPGAARRETLGQVLLECRFAFTQALREAPDHEGARLGLRSCLLTMIDQSLLAGNAEGAQALLGEVEDPPPLLRDRVLAAVEEREQLRRLASEVDLRVAGRQRRRIVLVAGVALLAACVWTLILHQPSHPGLLGTAALNLAIAVLLPLLFRGSLSSAANQRIRATWLTTAAMFMLGRIVGAVIGLAPTSVIAMEQVALAGVVAVFAAAWLPSLWTAAAALATGGLVAARFPALAGPVFVVTSTVGMAGSATARGRSISGRPGPRSVGPTGARRPG